MKIKNLGKISFMLLFVASCSVAKQKKSKVDSMIIYLGSKFENERVTLSINDSLIYDNKELNTNSLGIDSECNIDIKIEKAHLKGRFFARIDPGFDKNFIRELKIDTVLYRKKGRFIIIGANYEKYLISQQDKKFILD